MIRSTRLWLVVGLLLSLPGAITAQHLQEAWEIVPGKRIGPLEIGARESDVLSILGEPARREGGAWEYLQHGVALAFERGGTLHSILAGDTTLGMKSPLVAQFHGRTTDGLGLGSSQREIRSLLGKPEAERAWGKSGFVLSYPEKGIEWIVDADGLCHHLRIFPPESPAD